MLKRSWMLLALGFLLPSRLFAAAPPAPPANAAGGINLRQTVTVDVVRKTKDAVVYISTTKLVPTSPFANDPFFRQFNFGDMGAVPVPANSLGSGFLVHEDGYVITNNHVVERAREIQVELADGRKLNAELVSSDPEADLAVLRVQTDKPLPALELGDSSDLMIGEPVIAVGNPLGFSHSVSTGIVSAVHRDLGSEGERIRLKDLIQTDAAINPGNSGGPLLNAYGQVIGINTAIRGDAQNIGFAIQVNKLRDLIPDLLNPSQAAKVDLPVRLTESRKVIAPATIVAEVEFSPSEGKKIRVDALNGRKPRDLFDAYTILLKLKADETLTLKLADGSEQKITAKTVAPPDAIVQARKRLGITCEVLTPMLAQKYGMEIETGMLVTEVQRGSVAQVAGIKAGDVIIALGRYNVESLEDFATLLQHLPESGKVRIGVQRGQQRGFGVMDLGTKID